MNDRGVADLLVGLMYQMNIKNMEKEDRFLVLPKVLIDALSEECKGLLGVRPFSAWNPPPESAKVNYRGIFAGVDLYEPKPRFFEDDRYLVEHIRRDLTALNGHLTEAVNTYKDMVKDVEGEKGEGK